MKHNSFALFLLLAQVLCAHGQELRGRVVDAETGEPLPYASVYVSATSGTLTNEEGDFVLKGDDKDLLQVSYIGYEKQQLRFVDFTGIVRLKPSTHILQELTVVPEKDIRQMLVKLTKRLDKSYSLKKYLKTQYFYRLTNSNGTDKELVEAFVEARSAINLRELVFLSGRHFHTVEEFPGIQPPLLNKTNLQELMQLGPMVNEAPFWRGLRTPLTHMPNIVSQPNNIETVSETTKIEPAKGYDLSFELIRQADGDEIYKIGMRLKESYRSGRSSAVNLATKLTGLRLESAGEIEGSVYVDKKFRLLAFDGRLLDYSMVVTRNNESKILPMDCNIHINYTHRRGFPEIENMYCTMSYEKMRAHAIIYYLPEGKIRTNGKAEVRNNMMEAIQEAGYDSTLWTHEIIQHTEEEEKIIKKMPDLNIAAEDEDNSFGDTGPFRTLVKRITAFGRNIPQEKVYIHMDNTCYFQGDTIWFSVYTRQTDKELPSMISHVLYAELLNNDGYLVERKMIEMKEGRGNGFFALNNPVQYSGFYELRTYTRWQLNWGIHEHKHSKVASKWFITKELEREYYRDYDKLYSRVFPVYDRPLTPGNYTRDMTMRVMRRTFKNDPDAPRPILTLFPEGGNLVAGVPNRVAFEAAWSDGLQMEGSLAFESSPADSATSVSTRNRGRGVFTVTPEVGKAKEVVFTSADGQQVKAQLPKPEEQGVAITVRRDSAGTWRIAAHRTGRLSTDSLALTIMHEGRLTHFRRFAEVEGEGCIIPEAELQTGVQQATVFDTQGHVWADRLFFVTKADDIKPTLTVKGLKDEYQPHEKIRLEVEGAAADAKVSIAVRDAYQADGLFDNGTILTEMLLASEIRGFVPDAGWFFEKDDEEHREALDLLMMTQGWRRFPWRDMAIKGEWDLTQPAEATPIISGQVIKLDAERVQIDKMRSRLPDIQSELDDAELNRLQKKDEQQRRKGETLSKDEELRIKELKQAKKERTENANERTDRQGYTKHLKNEVRVFAKLVHVSSQKKDLINTESKDGRFSLSLPWFYGPAAFSVAASDSTKWKKESYNWKNETLDSLASLNPKRKYDPKADDFFVRLQHFYPRFVKPYSYWQTKLKVKQEIRNSSANRTDITLKEIDVKAHRHGQQQFNDAFPAFVVDAYEAYNEHHDAGILFADNPLARVYLSTYGVEAPSETNDKINIRLGLGPTRRGLPQYIDIPKDSLFYPKYLKSYSAEAIQDATTYLPYIFTTSRTVLNSLPAQIQNQEIGEYIGLWKHHKYAFYTDYAPRMEGNAQYEGANLPETSIVIYPIADGSQRIIYRSRYSIVDGFAVHAQFYSPDYSQQTPPEPSDYRRTLYWNPNVKLDHEGRANITLWNCSRTTRPQVEAAGQSTDGTLLWNKTQE